MLRLPEDDKVAFAGAVSLDQAGLGTGQILYPVPGLVGLFAAIATHGAIVETSKNHQKNQLQQNANLVMNPFESALSQFRFGELVRQALTMVRLGGNGTLIAGAAGNGTTFSGIISGSGSFGKAGAGTLGTIETPRA